MKLLVEPVETCFGSVPTEMLETVKSDGLVPTSVMLCTVTAELPLFVNVKCRVTGLPVFVSPKFCAPDGLTVWLARVTVFDIDDWPWPVPFVFTAVTP